MSTLFGEILARAGLTMFENDDLDLYKEENKADDANSYLSPKGFMNYQIRNKTIQVKDSSAVNFTSDKDIFNTKYI